MKIKIFSCGGTFEKVYDPIKGVLTFNKSAIPEILKRSRVTCETEFQALFFKDSLDMNADDRFVISNAINSDASQNIVLIHGTDTMVETAQIVRDNNHNNKIVVITGAMIPFSIKESDALFNFGSALTAAKLLKAGVWISMNGNIFDSAEVKKNKISGVFEIGKP